MGMECPYGHGRQPVVLNMTVDGQGAIHPDQILAQRLGCGCVVGGEDYDKFLKARETLVNQAARDKLAIDKTAQDKIAAIWQQIIAAKTEVKTNVV